MPRIIPEAWSWPSVARRIRDAVPEAFIDDGQPLNLVGGKWTYRGNGKTIVSPVDGSVLGKLPMIGVDVGNEAVNAADVAFIEWARLSIDQRIERTRRWLGEMRRLRDDLALLIAWEIGKTLPSARSDVDRCIQGVEWYCDQIGSMLTGPDAGKGGGGGREPLGVVSNIASWNYPLSVLVHACAVQSLAGNAVVAKTPTDGGGLAITVCFALAARVGLPWTLLSGSGGTLAPALVKNEHVACFSFVGGKSIGRDIAARSLRPGQRFMLEMEGLNAYGLWEFSDWNLLATQLKKGFEFGKQRCTAYVRFVVQRKLLPKFLETELAVLKSLKVGHPLAIDPVAAQPPNLPDHAGVDFGPLINAAKIEELHAHISEALDLGAFELFSGSLDDSLFLENQDRSSYLAPRLLLDVPSKAALHHAEPFGPVDTVVVVDTPEELFEQMNVVGGTLVSSIATDDPAFAERAKSEIRAFKVGVNAVRSRGDRDEPFGGLGQSWKGAFVGGKHLVEAVTKGPAAERLPGIYPDAVILPGQTI
jgi:acyl-CoA reductase-like NAD-dependent aldehyde dehydrogenase